MNWKLIATYLPGRSAQVIRYRFYKILSKKKDFQRINEANVKIYKKLLEQKEPVNVKLVNYVMKKKESKASDIRNHLSLYNELNKRILEKEQKFKKNNGNFRSQKNLIELVSKMQKIKSIISKTKKKITNLKGCQNL